MESGFPQNYSVHAFVDVSKQWGSQRLSSEDGHSLQISSQQKSIPASPTESLAPSPYARSTATPLVMLLLFLLLCAHSCLFCVRVGGVFVLNFLPAISQFSKERAPQRYCFLSSPPCLLPLLTHLVDIYSPFLCSLPCTKRAQGLFFFPFLEFQVLKS